MLVPLGREMLRRLVKHGISCSYVLVNTVSYAMKQVRFDLYTLISVCDNVFLCY